jgi:hypothetical protein
MHGQMHNYLNNELE